MVKFFVNVDINGRGECSKFWSIDAAADYLRDRAVDALMGDCVEDWSFTLAIDETPDICETIEQRVQDHIERKTKLEIDAHKARSMNFYGDDDSMARARAFHGERIKARREANSPW